jgi:large subunit ribosomal protein L13
MQKRAEVTREWHLVDADSQVLGRLATQIAEKLIGKNKPTYTPHIDGGDYVVVVNAANVKVTGNKEQDKMYHSYSGFPGGLSKMSFAELLEKHPEKVIERAVYNMIPKNKLRSGRMARLKIYPTAEHKHQSQLAKEEK